MVFISIAKKYISNIVNFTVKRKKIFLPSVMILLIAALCSIIIASEKSVTIVVDGSKKSVVTFKKTVGKFLTEQDIALNSKDKINVSLNSRLNNNETIKIKKAVKITVYSNGKTYKILSAEDNVNSMLKCENIKLSEKDKIQPSLNAKLYNGMNVDIIKVNQKTLVASSEIDYDTIIQSDDSMAATKTKVIQDGQCGLKNSTYLITYENGYEVSRVLINESISKKPTNKIVAKGTLPTLPVSRGGDDVCYRKMINVKATAYSSRGGKSGIGNTYTSSGRKAVRNSSGYSTIAVDPSVIPLGTKLYVEGYGFAIASDIGTAIKGNFIDVFFDTYEEACNWAVKYVKVYILAN